MKKFVLNHLVDALLAIAVIVATPSLFTMMGYDPDKVMAAASLVGVVLGFFILIMLFRLVDVGRKQKADTVIGELTLKAVAISLGSWWLIANAPLTPTQSEFDATLSSLGLSESSLFAVLGFAVVSVALYDVFEMMARSLQKRSKRPEVLEPVS